MATIGTFTARRDGGWEGRIRTLTINVRAQIIPNDNRDSDRSPDYLVYSGPIELGAAWIHHNIEPTGKQYLGIHLDDPSLNEPITAALFFIPGTDRARLVWSRHRDRSSSD